MEPNPRTPWHKRLRRKLSKTFKFGSKRRDQSPEQSASSAIVGPPDRSSSAPPGIPQPQAPSQVEESSASVVHVLAQATESVVGDRESTTNASFDGAATEPRLSTNHSASQTARVAARGVLRVLSNAADGIPVPGVKGIFDTITGMIDIVEVGGPDYHSREYIDQKPLGHRS